MASNSAPLILAVDTSTLTLSVALTRGAAPLAEMSLSLPRGHSRALLSVLDELVRRTGLSMEAVDAFAVGLGPGSFTGLRIGLALLKGLSLSYDKPLIGASSLHAIAARMALHEGLICPTVDARKAEVYAGLFRCSRDDEGTLSLASVGEEMVIGPRELAEELLFMAPGDESITFAGTGAQEYRGSLGASFGARARFAPAELGAPRARYIATQALDLLTSGEVPDSTTLEPRYIRPSDAEIHGPKPLPTLPG